MSDLAIVIVSCDRYSWFRPYWRHYFNEYFGFEYPVYMLVEKRADPIDKVKLIQSKIVNANEWTRGLYEGLKQIPEENVFVLMDDFLITKDITEQFKRIYAIFKESDADSFRIMADPNKHCQLTDYKVDGFKVERLLPNSEYKISFSPNIYKKSFLMKYMNVSESPWSSETEGSKRVKDALILHTIIPGWYTGALRKGKVLPEGKRLIENI